MDFCPFYIVPSAAPNSVSMSAVTSSSITVLWGAVDCIHSNGDITGYSVQYGVVGSGSTQNMSAFVTGATILGLMPFTNYSIQVAAENSAGIGDYTDHVIVETSRGKLLARLYQCHTLDRWAVYREYAYCMCMVPNEGI